MNFLRASILTCFGLSLLSGCGGSDLPPIAPLEGTVTMDGKPYANGSLVFTPTDGGRPSVAATDENGNFEAIYNLDTRGAMIGPHTVIFEPGGDKEEEDEFKEYAPPTESFKVSPSEITVVEGGTEIAFTLEKS